LVKLEICKFWLHCGAASIDKFSKGAVNKKSLKKKKNRWARLQHGLMSCSSRLTLRRRWIRFLHISVFWKCYKSF